MKGLLVIPAGRTSAAGAPHDVRLPNGETTSGRQARLLSSAGVSDLIVLGAPGPLEEAEIRAHRTPAGKPVVFIGEGEPGGRRWWDASADDDVVILRGDVFFDVALLRRLMTDSRSDVAVPLGSGASPATDFPMCRLGAASAGRWFDALAESDALADPDATIAALTGFVRETPVPLLSAAGHFVAEQSDSEAQRVFGHVRELDILQQPVASEGHGPPLLKSALRRLDITRPLLLCDGDYDTVELTLRLAADDIGLVKLTVSPGAVDYQEARAATEAFHANGCDGILAIGGDAAIEFAKCVKLFAALDPARDLLDQEFGFSPTKLVAVPVGAGAGSDATPFARLSVEGRTRHIAHDTMLPDQVVITPSASLGLSAPERRAVGAAVLCRSIDAILSRGATRASDESARKALDLLARSLFPFIGGDDLSAHTDLANAAHLAGVASAVAGPAAVHGAGAAIADRFGIDFTAAMAISVVPLLAAAAGPSSATTEAQGDARLRGAVESLCTSLDVKDPVLAIELVTRLLSTLDVPPAPDSHDADPAALSAATAAAHRANALQPLDDSTLEAIYARALRRPDPLPGGEATGRTFDLLQRLTGFFERNDIQYFLYGETLRDAVVHGRLMPWNAGLSIAIPRRSHSRLMSIQDRLPDGIDLADLPGISISILEGRSGHTAKSVVQTTAQRMLREGYSAAASRPLRSRNPLRRGARAVAGRAGSDRLDAISMRVGSAARQPQTYVDLAGHRAFAKSQFPGSWFGKGRTGSLNGVPFTVPARATSVLRRMFGAGYRSVQSISLTASMRAVPVADPPLAATEIREDPFFSVIVPVYDVEKYLPGCLDSLCGQDYDKYEIIAVNDGSPDDSQRILEEYAQRYPDLVRILQKENGGLGDARNFGIPHAKGEYLVFVDSDDFVSSGMLRILADRIRTTDADIVVFGFYDYWSGSEQLTRRPMEFTDRYGRSIAERPEMLVGARPYAWNKTYRKTLFTDFGISYPKGQAFEDSATTFNLMLEAKRIEYVDEGLYFYRRDNAGSITNQVDARMYDVFKSFESIRQYYKRRGAYDEFRSELQEVMRRVTLSRLNFLEGATDLALVDAFLDAVYDYLDTEEPGWATNPYAPRPQDSPNPRTQALPDRAEMKAYFAEVVRATLDAAAEPDQLSTQELGEMLQREGLGILLKIDSLCREHGITYYLCEGTLLGAIRHQGFVPWDDDIDICMPRADYERFNALMLSDTDPTLRLFNERTYPKYHLTFTKVLSAAPSEFTTMFVDVPAEYRGPAVDIFPLDAGVQPRSRAREWTVRWLRDVLLFKAGHLTREKRPTQHVRRLASRVLTYRFLQRTIQRSFRIHERGKDTGYVVNFASSYTVPKEKFRSEWFREPRQVPFEGHLLPVPNDADAVLRTTYGDYIKPPPENKRVFRHRPLWRGQGMTAR